MRVVGVDDIAECRYTVPSLTSLGSVKKEIAQRAIRLLARRIDERDAPLSMARLRSPLVAS